jgi:hypothetical protein
VAGKIKPGNGTIAKDFSTSRAEPVGKIHWSESIESFTSVSSASMNSPNESETLKTGSGSETRAPDLQLRLPLPGNRANSRDSNLKAYRLKAEYYERCRMEILAQGIRKVPKLERATYEAVVVALNPYDNDNLVALLKWPQDFLAQMGVVETDGAKFLWPRKFPMQKTTKKPWEQSRTAGVYYRLWKASLQEIEELSKCAW